MLSPFPGDERQRSRSRLSQPELTSSPGQQRRLSIDSPKKCLLLAAILGLTLIYGVFVIAHYGDPEDDAAAAPARTHSSKKVLALSFGAFAVLTLHCTAKLALIFMFRISKRAASRHTSTIIIFFRSLTQSRDPFEADSAHCPAVYTGPACMHPKYLPDCAGTKPLEGYLTMTIGDPWPKIDDETHSMLPQRVRLLDLSRLGRPPRKLRKSRQQPPPFLLL